jgi:hypothetical protein
MPGAFTKPQLWHALPAASPLETSLVPQIEQNWALGSTALLHLEHSRTPSFNPHCPQNAASALLSVPQTEHFIR